MYEVLGYPRQLQFADFLAMYERDGLATRIVDAVSDETWRERPSLSIGENVKRDELDNPDEFQRSFTQLAERLDLFTAFNEADASCGISRFALILLGLPGDMEQPAPVVLGPSSLLYVSVHDEGSAEVDELSIVTDMKSPRFGLPEYYFISVDASHGARYRVHYSRVIHVKEGRSRRLYSKIYGVPRLQPMFNRLMDLEKVVGGGSEAFWLLIHRGMLISAKENAQVPPQGSPNFEDIRDEIEDYANQIKRWMLLSNVDVTDLGGQPVDSDAQFNTIIDYLAGASHIPQRILVGSEAGQLASSQDEYNFAAYISARQKRFAEPYILRAFIDRCGQLGVLKVPPKYTVTWPSLFQLTESDKASIAGVIAGALSTASGGAPETIMPPDEFAKRYLDYVPPEPTFPALFPKAPGSQGVPAKVPEFSWPTPAQKPESLWSKLTGVFGPKRQKTDIRKIADILSKKKVSQFSNPWPSTWRNEADDNEYSVMVALRIPDAISAELSNRFPFIAPEILMNLHITLCYIGDSRALDMTAIMEAVMDFASIASPLKVKLGGITRFAGDNGIDPVVLTADSPELPGFHHALTALLDIYDIPYHKERVFSPGVTLAYVPHDAALPVQSTEPLEVNFNEIYLYSGSTLHSLKLGNPPFEGAEDDGTSVSP
jgi:hypothetical protein